MVASESALQGLGHLAFLPYEPPALPSGGADDANDGGPSVPFASDAPQAEWFQGLLLFSIGSSNRLSSGGRLKQVGIMGVPARHPPSFHPCCFPTTGVCLAGLEVIDEEYFLTLDIHRCTPWAIFTSRSHQIRRSFTTFSLSITRRELSGRKKMSPDVQGVEIILN